MIFDPIRCRDFTEILVVKNRTRDFTITCNIPFEHKLYGACLELYNFKGEKNPEMLPNFSIFFLCVVLLVTFDFSNGVASR